MKIDLPISKKDIENLYDRLALIKTAVDARGFSNVPFVPMKAALEDCIQLLEWICINLSLSSDTEEE